jgi:hypothetical protein
VVVVSGEEVLPSDLGLAFPQLLAMSNKAIADERIVVFMYYFV